MACGEFIQWLASAAQEERKKYNLPASVLIAQGAIESGWGEAIIGKYNLFGRRWN
jgi:flagellum-specific peptidoglycan hydrolase FlgJ